VPRYIAAHVAHLNTRYAHTHSFAMNSAHGDGDDEGGNDDQDKGKYEANEKGDDDVPLQEMGIKNEEDEDEKENDEEAVQGQVLSREEVRVFEIKSDKAYLDLQRKLDAASAADPVAWESFYKKRMGMAIQFFNTKLAEADDRWEFVTPSDPEESIALYQQPVAGGYYILKACGRLNARADRVMHLNKDNSWETRQLWDNEDLDYVARVHSLACDEGTINVVKSHIKVDAPLVSNRFSLGIQWHGHDPELNTYKMVFKTVPHFFETCPDTHVAIDSLSGVWVRPLEPIFKQQRGSKKPPIKVHQCDCVIIAYVNPKGWIPAWVINLFKDKLRQRLHTYERVAGKEWKKHYGGKNPARARTREERESLVRGTE